MKLTEVTKILALSPIEGADRIERATVLGWQCVVKKGLHNVGDLVVFVFPDTKIPKKFLDESYEGDEKVRLRTVKMRGQYSAGLVIPLAVLSEGTPALEGDDVAEHLNIEKWEAPISPQLAGVAAGNFPSIISKTDEDNYRSNPGAVRELKEERFDGQEFYATVKCDGTSATFLLDPNEDVFRVCSRNLELKKDENNTLWKMAEKYQIEKILREAGGHLAIQGEAAGEGIQGNPMRLKGQHLFVFLMKNLDTGSWIPWNTTQQFCAQHGLETVPELFRLKVEEIDLRALQTAANNVKYDNGATNGEGLVLRSVVPIVSNALGKSWWSVKFISEPYDSKKG